jgi:hypothetical protein
MAVAYDNAKSAIDFGVTTLSSGTFTIGSGADRVAMVCLSTVGNPGAITSVTCGGQSGTAVASASGDGPTWWFAVYKVLNPAAGTQSASVTWTNSLTGIVSVITVTGASDINGGAYSEAAANNHSLNISSNAGDLTASFSANGTTDTVYSTNQTLRLSGIETGGDTGPGTAGPITHTWTHTGETDVNGAGANFVSASTQSQAPRSMHQHALRS